AAGVAGGLAAAFARLPALGLGGGLLAAAAVLAALAAVLATPAVLRWGAAVAATGLAAAGVLAPPLPFPWRASLDERVLLRRDGPTATVLVTTNDRAARGLRAKRRYPPGAGDRP